MSKVQMRTLESVTGNDAAATALINQNFKDLQDAIDNTVSRDGDTPNYMDADLDLNNKRILNLADPVDDHDAISKKYFLDTIGNAASYATSAAVSANAAASSAQSAAVSAATAIAELQAAEATINAAVANAVNTAAGQAQADIANYVNTTVEPSLQNSVNTAYNYSLDSYNYANSAGNYANASYNYSLASYSYSNNSSNFANNSSNSANTSLGYANNSSNYANNSSNYANNANVWAEGTDEQVQALGGTHSSKVWSMFGKYYVGQIIESPLPITDASLRLLDGSLIQGGGIYDEFVQYVAGLVSTYPGCFTTEAAWQQSVTDYGVCGKFVYDSLNNTVRLPKISSAERYLIKSYHSGDDWYRVYSDGWCEQGGLVYIPSSDLTVTFLIPFLNTDYTITAGSSNNTNVVNVNQSNARTATNTRFDMSGSNSGNAFWQACGYVDISSYSTREKYEYIVVATSVKTDIEVDIDQITVDLANKANKDLSNITQATKSDVTSWAFPDSAFTNLTLGASGSTYTASDDGWFHIAKRGTAAGQFIIVMVSSSGLMDGGVHYGNGVEIDILIPVRKGQVLQVIYTSAGVTERFRFCKAYGVA